MAQLRQEFEQFAKRDTVIVILGPENAASFKSYWEKNQLPFIGLPDEQKQLLKLGRMPAQMLIDKQGILRFAHYGNSMQDIPDSTEIFEILDQLKAQ